MKTKIICLGGKAQHGKDTSAKYLQEHLTEIGKKVLIVHQADLLKNMARDMFGWDGQKDEKGRRLLQYLGTDLVRQRDPDFWVDHLVRTLTVLDGEWDIVLIPDTRFPNEIQKFKDVGFNVTYMRVIRSNFKSPLTEEQQNHFSETALDNVDADLYVYNGGTLEVLSEMMQQIAFYLIGETIE